MISPNTAVEWLKVAMLFVAAEYSGLGRSSCWPRSSKSLETPPAAAPITGAKSDSTHPAAVEVWIMRHGEREDEAPGILFTFAHRWHPFKSVGLKPIRQEIIGMLCALAPARSTHR